MQKVLISQPQAKPRQAVIIMDTVAKSKAMPIVVHADAMLAKYAVQKSEPVSLGDQSKQQFEKLAATRLKFVEDGMCAARAQLRRIRKLASVTDVSGAIAEFYVLMRSIKNADADCRGLHTLMLSVGTTEQDLKALAKKLMQTDVGFRAETPRIIYPDGNLFGNIVFVQLLDDRYVCEIELEHADETSEIQTIMGTAMYVSMKKETDRWIYCPVLSDRRVVKTERFLGSVSRGLVSLEDEVLAPTSGYVNAKQFVDDLFKGTDYDPKLY